MVLEAILTSRQAREKLHCLYENLMSNNFRKMHVLKILDAESENISYIDLVTVFDAIFTSRQTREKLQCLYENLISNNCRKTAVLKKI